MWRLSTARRATTHSRARAATTRFGLKIVELLDDENKRKAMGAYDRKRVIEELAWRHEAPELLAACEILWRRQAWLAIAE
jgi:hypothetical protein